LRKDAQDRLLEDLGWNEPIEEEGVRVFRDQKEDAERNAK